MAALGLSTTTATYLLTTDSSEPSVSWSSVFLVFIMAVLSLFTVLGNLIVLLSYYLDKNIRQPSNYFIFSLAVSDLVGFTFIEVRKFSKTTIAYASRCIIQLLTLIRVKKLSFCYFLNKENSSSAKFKCFVGRLLFSKMATRRLVRKLVYTGFLQKIRKLI